MGFVSHATRTARKQYKCNLCGLPIAAGERHEYFAGHEDGSFWTARSHSACQNHTKDWDEDDWFYHEPAEFRRTYLNLGDDAGERATVPRGTA